MVVEVVVVVVVGVWENNFWPATFREAPFWGVEGWERAAAGERPDGCLLLPCSSGLSGLFPPPPPPPPSSGLSAGLLPLFLQ